jgi:hypothetical protein
MHETLDDAALLIAELLASRWLPRRHPRVRRALIDAELWQTVQDRLALSGLRLVDNIHADHVCVALLRGAETAVFGETGLNANNNARLPRDAVSLLVLLWSLIVLPKRERQAARAATAETEGQTDMFTTERPLPSAASVSPVVSYKALLADFGPQLGRKTRMDGNLKRLETRGFIVRKGDDIGEGPLLDLLLDYDALAPRILEGALGDVLARARQQAETDAAAPARDDGSHPTPADPATCAAEDEADAPPSGTDPHAEDED